MQTTLRQAAAEFLGTFLLIAFGCGVVAQTVLSGGAAGSPLGIHLGWGLGVALAIYVVGGISGAHINPAVTLALAVHRGFPWRKVPLYVGAQVAGAFAGALLVYLTYHEALDAFDGGVRQVLGDRGTAGIFATYPAAHLSTFPGGLIDQTVGTALLVLGILGIVDRRNALADQPLAGLAIGALVVVIGMTYGFNAGYAINPARDLGPRMFTAIFGWGPEVFTAGSGWWWVPIAGPCLGGVLAGSVYDGLLGRPPVAAPAEPAEAIYELPRAVPSTVDAPEEPEPLEIDAESRG